MRDLTPYSFEPEHQPFDEPVRFQLRPLNLPEYFTVQLAYSRGGVDWPVVEGVAQSNILGWSGIQPEYSKAALREILRAGGNEWGLWLLEITANLYRRAMLSETERKN